MLIIHLHATQPAKKAATKPTMRRRVAGVLHWMLIASERIQSYAIVFRSEEVFVV